MKCPRCGFENQDGKIKCSMCHYELVHNTVQTNNNTSQSSTMNNISFKESDNVSIDGIAASLKFNAVNQSNTNTSKPKEPVTINKIAKTLKLDYIFLFVLSLVLCVLYFFAYDKTISLRLIIQAGYSLLLFAGIFLAAKKKTAAGTMGLLIGVLMAMSIINKDIIDFLLGIFLVSHSLKYNNIMDK